MPIKCHRIRRSAVVRAHSSLGTKGHESEMNVESVLSPPPHLLPEIP